MAVRTWQLRGDAAEGYVQVQGFDKICSVMKDLAYDPREAPEALLALDTSGALCAVALLLGDRLLQDTRKVERKHNEVLLPMLDGLFAEAGLRPTAVSGVAFAAGPGSFTGVRLAASAAQAVALAASAVVLPVRNSERLAEHAQTMGQQGVLTSTHSRADAYYLGHYAVELDDAGETEMVALRPDVLVHDAPDWAYPELAVAGDCPSWLPFARRVPPDDAPARTLLRIAARGWRRGQFGKPETALPIYVEGDTPWRAGG